MKKECEVIEGITRKLAPCLIFLAVIIFSNCLLAFSWPDDSAYLNIKINNDTTEELQNEEQIVMNPKDSTNLVAVWRDFRLGYRQVGYGYSFDGGLTWNQSLFVNPCYPYDSDPGITVDTAGYFYAQILGYTGSIDDPNGLFVYKSTDGGMTWGGAVIVVNGVPDVFEDKGLIACDRSGGPYTDNLYVAWARLSSTKDIFLARSTDGGNTFEAPVAVSDIPGSQWPVPCVGSNSEAYIAWYQWAQQEIRFDRSTNGGQSFGVDITIQQLDWQGGNINGEILVIPFPATDVDVTNGPYRGTIYVAYMDYAPGNTDTDIYFTRSTDGGTTWSQKTRINDDPLNNGCDQFHPWLIVAPDGSIIVVFLDRRLDPNNLLMDCYMTTSTDRGDTWSPNERITTMSSDPTAGSTLETYAQIGNPSLIFANRAGLIGEYIGVTASSIDDIHPIWTDTRFGNQDVFVGVADTSGPYIREYITHEINTPMLLVAPNPFTNQTEMRYSIPESRRLTQKPILRIYDACGRVVKSFNPESSIRNQELEVLWDGLDDHNMILPRGVYFVKFNAGDYSATEKLLLIR
jgi:hypothetical protein